MNDGVRSTFQQSGEFLQSHRQVSHRGDDYSDAAEALDRSAVGTWRSQSYPAKVGDHATSHGERHAVQSTKIVPAPKVGVLR